MSESLLEFLTSPGAAPLAESAAAGVRGRNAVITEAVATALGVSTSELLRTRAQPLDRIVHISTADAAPASVRPTIHRVEPCEITSSGMSFLYDRDISLRRVIVDIGPPPLGQPGAAVCFIATVIEQLSAADDKALLVVRFQSVVD